eukprot:m.356495 g.356495  ORF g.356495 m.356495 type:complete len:248 (-) comp17553_c0_seq1:323-1066(-)
MMSRGLLTLVLALCVASICLADDSCTIVNSLGCYDSKTNPMVNNPEGTAASWIVCIQNCFAAGYTNGVAGILGGSMCYCSNSKDGVGNKVDDNECNLQCPNNKAKYCGGPSAITEFSFNCAASTAPTTAPPIQTYSCQNNQCMQDPSGTYNEPTCNGECNPATTTAQPPTKGLTIGGIMVVIFFCALLLPYCIFGALFMRFKREKSGMEMMPNKEFWSALPGLIWDGIKFTFSGFKSIGGANYQSLK